MTAIAVTVRVRRDERVLVERVVDDDLAHALEILGRLRPVLEQLPDAESELVTARHARVDQAVDLVDVGDVVRECLVQRAQTFEGREVEDLGRLDRHENVVVARELVSEAVVGNDRGVVVEQERFGRVVDRDVRHVARHHRSEAQTHQRHHPLVPTHEEAPPLEGDVDLLADADLARGG